MFLAVQDSAKGISSVSLRTEYTIKAGICQLQSIKWNDRAHVIEASWSRNKNPETPNFNIENSLFAINVDVIVIQDNSSFGLNQQSY